MKNGKEIDQYGNVRYYKKNKPHRTDGPAIEFTSGTKAWYINDKLHREDGPAIEWASGTKEWWLNDKEVRLEDVLNTPEKLENYLLNETLKKI
jgi:hypothetical protein